MKLRVASSLISPVVSSSFEAQLPMKISGRGWCSGGAANVLVPRPARTGIGALTVRHHDTPPAGGNVNLLAEERLKGRKSLTEQ
jgi:hypothetical protein